MTGYLQQRTLFPPQIQNQPSPNLGLVVVIPAYDEPFLLLSLMNLKKCMLPTCDIEVIILINESDKSSDEVKIRNHQIADQAAKWIQKNNHPRLKFFLLHHTLPAQHAGVGLARKIGMDEACWRLENARNPQGIIACFDADSRCDENYFIELEHQFNNYPSCPACSIYFEHPLSGVDFDPAIYEAITQYELHLRYYIRAQRFAGFPHAFHTVGSSMAVRCSAYQKQGGMNKKKAGEDFYFIHKFTLLPGFSELNSTRIIPSARPSHRVPFGTGKAIQQMIRKREEYRTYAFQSFEELYAFIDLLPSIYEQGISCLDTLPIPLLHSFLKLQHFHQKLDEFKRHSASYITFQKRFFYWFNAFMVMKYLHYARENGRDDVPVSTAAYALIQKLGLVSPSLQFIDLLHLFRKMDKDHGIMSKI